jgi:hypothetical protein
LLSIGTPEVPYRAISLVLPFSAWGKTPKERASVSS